MNRILRLLCLTLLLALPSVTRADVTVPLTHGKLHLPVPDGYCMLDTDLARESSLFDVEAKTFEGRSRLLGMAADCGQLTAFRLRHTAVTQIVSFLLALKDDQGVRRPDAERAQYLDTLAKQFGKVQAKDFAANAEQWWNISNPSAEPVSFGLAERDGSAVYLQAVRKIGRYEPAPIASVSALTLVQGYEVAVNFYIHGDEHSLPGLLALAEHEAQGLIAANPPPPPAPNFAELAAPTAAADQAAADAPPGTDGAQLKPLGAVLAESGSTIIMIAGGVLLLAVLFLFLSRGQKASARR